VGLLDSLFVYDSMALAESKVLDLAIWFFYKLLRLQLRVCSMVRSYCWGWTC